jgi:hypothetical protein
MLLLGPLSVHGFAAGDLALTLEPGIIGLQGVALDVESFEAEAITLEPGTIGLVGEQLTGFSGNAAANAVYYFGTYTVITRRRRWRLN